MSSTSSWTFHRFCKVSSRHKMPSSISQWLIENSRSGREILEWDRPSAWARRLPLAEKGWPLRKNCWLFQGFITVLRQVTELLLMFWSISVKSDWQCWCVLLCFMTGLFMTVNLLTISCIPSRLRLAFKEVDSFTDVLFLCPIQCRSQSYILLKDLWQMSQHLSSKVFASLMCKASLFCRQCL